MQSFDESGDDFEEIADNSVVGYLEDRRIGILVDRNDALRSLHAHQVLNCAGDADSHIQLRRHGLARAADLPLHGEPAIVADGPRTGQFGAQGVGKFLDHRDVLGFLDASAYGDDDFRRAQIDRARRLAKEFERISADASGIELGRGLFDDGRSGFELIGTERARLDRREVERVAFEAYVRVDLALEKLPHGDQRTVVDAMPDYVADQDAVQCSGEFGGEVAHLAIGVGKDQPYFG